MSAALAVRDSMLQAFQLGQQGSTPSQSEGVGPATTQPAQPSEQPPAQQEEACGSGAAASEPEAALGGVEAGPAAADAEAVPDGGEAPPAAANAAAGGAVDGAGTPSGSVARNSCGRSSTEIEEVQPASHGALAEPRECWQAAPPAAAPACRLSHVGQPTLSAVHAWPCR